MWSDIASSSHSFWQSSLWESILLDSHQAYDVEVFSYGIEAVMIEFRPVGLGMMGAFSLGVDMSLHSEVFLTKCRDYISSLGAIFWQIEEYHPSWVPVESVRHNTYGKHFLEPWTRTIDLTLPEEDLLSLMHEKWRYNIRVAWKRWVKVTWADPTVDHIDMWMELLGETTSRDSFAQNSRAYYISFLQMLRDSNSGGMLFAGYNGRIIAAGIFVYYHGTALYYYGASTSDPELRKHMAPYMLQWEAIREGKLRGCKTYDFLGIAPPDEENHPLAGVTNFKEKFWGRALMIGSKRLYILGYIRYAIFVPLRILKNLYRRIVAKLKS